MLKYHLLYLSSASQSGLSHLQSKVDAEFGRKSKYDVATKLFRSKAPKAVFDEIKNELKKHSPAGEACYYCEQDRHRDIDHFYPKRHYPEKAFDWENYVYACTICNQDKKNDRFAVFDAHENVVEFDRALAFSKSVPVGAPVPIDIRHEDPHQFLRVDLDTGLYVACGVTSSDVKRGIYTRDLFDLDSDVLSRYRRHAVRSFEDYLSRYEEELISGRLARAKRVLEELLELPFPSVFIEMRRQAKTGLRYERLIALLPSDFKYPNC